MPSKDRVKPVAWAAIATLVVASLSWAMSVTGRLGAVESRVTNVERVSERLDSIDQRLSHIEGKLDAGK